MKPIQGLIRSGNEEQHQARRCGHRLCQAIGFDMVACEKDRRKARVMEYWDLVSADSIVSEDHRVSRGQTRQQDTGATVNSCGQG